MDHDADADTERTVIRPGREFEQEYRLSAAEAGRFLSEVGAQLQESEDLRIVDDEWELPFAVGEPIDVEVDFEGVGEPELELEVTIPGTSDDTAPDVA